MCNSPKGYGGCGMGWSVFTSSRVSRARSDSPICSFWKGAKNRAKKQVSGAIAVLRKVIVGGSIHLLPDPLSNSMFYATSESIPSNC